jgi:hypothetical protein
MDLPIILGLTASPLRNFNLNRIEEKPIKKEVLELALNLNARYVVAS